MKPQPRPYRAQIVGSDEWTEGWYEKESDRHYILCPDALYYRKVQVIPSTLGQSTGEFDKLSQPLWQDDVCKDLRGDRWLIIWKKGAFWLENMETKCRWLLDGSKVVKVGTIYDSPAKLYGNSEAKHQEDDEE